MNYAGSGHVDVLPPAELRRARAWLCRRSDKTPVYASGVNRHGTQGSDADRAELVTFDEAQDACKRLGLAGVGLAILPELGIVAFDFDKCVADGAIHPEVLAVVADCAYVEFSPSGTGLHAFTRGALSDRKSPATPGKYGFEVFSGKGYLTWTGNAALNCDLFDTSPKPIPQALFDLYEQRFGLPSLSGDAGDLMFLGRDDALSAITEQTIEDVASAVTALSSARADAHSDWLEVMLPLASLKATPFADRARQLAHLFSAKCPSKYNAREIDRWFDREAVTKVTHRTIFKLAAADGWVNPATLRRETFGDISNGARFAAKYRGQLLFVHGSDRWLHWDRTRWAAVDSGVTTAAAKTIAEEAFKAATEAVKADDSEFNKRSFNAALAVHRNVNRLHGMLTVAASEPGMSIPDASALDADAMLLGVRNGVVDLRTGTLLDAKPSMLISKQAGATFDRSATCPQFTTFLNAVFKGDAELIRFFQRAIGYTLTGLVDEEVLFFLHGKGANGKSVLANVLSAVFGDYAVTVRAELLATRKTGSEAAREVPRLIGARLALINEVARDELFDDQRVKELVSREKISGRALYSDGVEFMPTHKVWIRGNHQPGVRDASDGFWRRVLLVGFDRQFSEAEQIIDLDRRLLEERDGILMWAIEGCQLWRASRLKPPASVRAAVAAYRSETDLIGEWLDACCDQGPGYSTATEALFDSFDQHARRAGMHPGSRIAFGRELGSRGLKPVQVRRGLKGWQGVRLLTMTELAAPDAPDNSLF